MKANIYMILLMMLLSGCEKVTEWNIEPTEPKLVGDCIITNEYKKQIANIYWSSDSLNQQPVGYSGAQVEITDGIHVYAFAEDVGQPGKYTSVLPFRASAGSDYRLTIVHDEGSDTAYASVSGVPPLEDPVIRREDGYFKYVVVPSSGSYMLELYYDWSAANDYCEQYGACQAMETYYVLDNIDIGKTFAPDRYQIVFPLKTTLIRKKYSLSVEHQEFARALMLETEWRGGVFDAEAGNLPTNFRNGMIGWFAACTVVSDTLGINQ